MTDVAIDVSGTMSAPPPKEYKDSLFTKGLPKIPTLAEFYTSCRESIRPWTQFVNTSNFKPPPTLPRLIKRAVNNITYFQGNYVVISLILMAYCLLTSPLLLISVAASLLICYKLSQRSVEKKLTLNGRDIPLQQQYALVGICSLPVYYWAGVGQAVFWVLGASCFIVSLHAGLYNIEEILREEDQLEVLLQTV